MRRAHRLALALAGVLSISASATQAADGIKATATATRAVPADVLVVTFQITERAVPGEGAADQRGILAKALQRRGSKFSKDRHVTFLRLAGTAQANSI